MKKYLFFFMFVFFISLIIGIQITNFDNRANSFNITFTSNENYTYNITFYKNANVTSATMNLSGWNLAMSNSYNGLSFVSLAIYGNDTRYAEKFVNTTGNISKIGVWLAKYNNPSGNITFVVRNYSDDAILDSENFGLANSITQSPTFSFYELNFNSSIYIPADFYISIERDNLSVGSVLIISPTNQGNCYQASNSSALGYFYNGTWNRITNSGQNCDIGFIITFANYPTNSNITINNTQIWNYTGSFNQTNNKTNDFSTILNSALNNGSCDCQGCQLINKNCSINFTFHSDTAGILGVGDLNINWLEYTKPNLTISSPSGSYGYVLNIPLIINASDDWQLSYCYFNVTRGASIEVSNTPISNLQSTTFTVSGDANYNVFVFCNDTSNNVNYTNKSFTVNQGGGGGSGGGGSAPYSVSNVGNWSMTTEAGNTYYDIKMTKESIRDKNINFENFGTSLRKITLRCENIPNNNSADICDYVNFEQNFDLPVQQGIKTVKPISINLPNSFPNGNYRFNIYAEDDSGNEQVVTFDVGIGNFGLVTNFLIKSLSSAKLGNFNIPYLIIGVGIGFIIFIMFSLILNKKSYGLGLSFIFGIISGIIGIMIL